MRSGLSRKDIQGKMKGLVEALFINIPSGVGSRRKDLKLNREEERKVLKKGAKWAVERGFGSAQDLEHIEEQGCIEGADPDRVSDKAMERGTAQLGTLGSGNHRLTSRILNSAAPPSLLQKGNNISQPWPVQPTLPLPTGR